MKRFLFAVAVLVGFVAGMSNTNATTIKVKNVAEDERPPQTAVVAGVFNQSLTFEIVAKGKDKNKEFVLDNLQVGGFNTIESKETPQDLGKYARAVYFIANTSPGNSVPSEMTIIAYAVINEDTGTSVTVYSGTHKIGNHARLTAVFVPRDDLVTGDTIGLSLNSIEARDSSTGEKVDVVGKFPIYGTEQSIDTSISAGKVYVGKTSLTIDGNIYPAIFIHPEWGNLLLKKIAFRDYINKKTRLSVWPNGKDYKCLADSEDGLTSCAFYKKYPELSPSKSSISMDQLGIPIYGGNWIYIYSKNDPQILNHLADLMDVVVVGMDWNYRYLPVQYDGGGMACFRAGTKVKMADRKEKAIETVKVGDWVWTGLGKSVRVSGVIKKIDPKWMVVNSTRTVPDQIFFVKKLHVFFKPVEGSDEPKLCFYKGEESLVSANSMKIGDSIINDDGKTTLITHIECPIKEDVTTYDLILDTGSSDPKLNFYYADGYKVQSVIENRKSFRTPLYPMGNLFNLNLF